MRIIPIRGWLFPFVIPRSEATRNLGFRRIGNPDPSAAQDDSQANHPPPLGMTEKNEAFAALRRADSSSLLSSE